jgi:putative DNA primase/helicase
MDDMDVFVRRRKRLDQTIRSTDEIAKARAYVDSLLAKNEGRSLAKRPPNGQTSSIQEHQVVDANMSTSDPALAVKVTQLAELAPLDYERVREKEAKEQGIRKSELDKAVIRARAVEMNDKARTHPLGLEELEPWHEPVDGVLLLDELTAVLKRYLVLPPHGEIAIALWIAHAHCFEVFEHTPRLNVTAPEKNCGKTLLLDVLQALTPRAIRTENVTTAVLFRLIDQHKPTVLLDEYDSFLRHNEELRGALNAGHKRGGHVLRCEGDDNDLRAFKTFGPVALAGIGALPGTLADRSIVIQMKRAIKGEIVERFDSRKTEGLRELARKLSRWGKDHMYALRDADPEMPEGFYNRAADNWRPLFAIADAVGSNWPDLARDAARKLCPDKQSSGRWVQLLGDIQQVLVAKKADRISSEDLTKALLDIEEGAWTEAQSGKPITKAWLSRQLRKFDVISKTVGFPARPDAKGYIATQFDDAFARYLANETSERRLPTATGDCGDFGNVGSTEQRRFGKPLEANNDGASDVPTFPKVETTDFEAEA